MKAKLLLRTLCGVAVGGTLAVLSAPAMYKVHKNHKMHGCAPHRPALPPAAGQPVIEHASVVICTGAPAMPHMHVPVHYLLQANPLFKIAKKLLK